MNTKTTLLSLLSAGAVTFSAHGQVTISFGGNYVSSNQSSQATLTDISDVPGAGDSIRQIGGFTVSANPVIGGDYSGPAFFGGAQVVKIGVDAANGLASAEVINDASGDYINLFAQTPAGVAAGSSLNYVFAMAAGSIRYGDLTGFSGRTAGGVSASLDSRFMVETTGGDIYLSTTSISGGAGGSTWSIADLAAEDWALFTPGANDWRGDFGSLTFNQTIAASTELANVGWFASRPVDTGTNSTLTIREFNVTAVPEPSAYGLIAAVLSLGVVILRRRR